MINFYNHHNAPYDFYGYKIHKNKLPWLIWDKFRYSKKGKKEIIKRKALWELHPEFEQNYYTYLTLKKIELFGTIGRIIFWSVFWTILGIKTYIGME